MKTAKDGKLSGLINILKKMRSALLAYSGGVDSTFLLKALSLSGIKSIAVTSVTDATPEWDVKDAAHYACLFGIEHRIISTEELQNRDFIKNSERRCFYCKDELFRKLSAIASKEGYECVLDGSTTDDLTDYRPGMEAKKAHNVRSPLIEVGYSKAAIRAELKKLGIPIWNKPSSPCLSSRIPYGTEITIQALRQVAGAEKYLRDLGFKQLRVRHMGTEARIELLTKELPRAFKLREAILNALSALGYKTITLDLEGFRSGKMNDKLNLRRSNEDIHRHG